MQTTSDSISDSIADKTHPLGAQFRLLSKNPMLTLLNAVNQQTRLILQHDKSCG